MVASRQQKAFRYTNLPIFGRPHGGQNYVHNEDANVQGHFARVIGADGAGGDDERLCPGQRPTFRVFGSALGGACHAGSVATIYHPRSGQRCRVVTVLGRSSLERLYLYGRGTDADIG